MQKEMYICFIDYIIVFHKVKHEGLLKMLESLGLGTNSAYENI